MGARILQFQRLEKSGVLRFLTPRQILAFIPMVVEFPKGTLVTVDNGRSFDLSLVLSLFLR